eukprot:TRINITY_DN2525_c0_g1_i1.p1 TRINITY_DN2525_c0_g1~~TRINITY_DN2525_c0_g1_i1.p1  ORF type:complete len:119 (-),score=3.95 TRINITY_DN2525_c0_g1_i1:273-629(-)
MFGIEVPVVSSACLGSIVVIFRQDLAAYCVSVSDIVHTRGLEELIHQLEEQQLRLFKRTILVFACDHELESRCPWGKSCRAIHFRRAARSRIRDFQLRVSQSDIIKALSLEGMASESN